MRIGIAADHGGFELKVHLTAANKVPGARAALITDTFSADQGVEDDDMNVMCLGVAGSPDKLLPGTWYRPSSARISRGPNGSNAALRKYPSWNVRRPIIIDAQGKRAYATNSQEHLDTVQRNQGEQAC